MKTVQDLIDHLSALPEEQKAYEVFLEGCDCTNAWNGTSYPFTLIGRDPHITLEAACAPML